MILSPAIPRELRMRARHRNTYWGRCLVGAAGALIALEITRAAGIAGWHPEAIGTVTFRMLSWGALLLVCSATVLTADCVGSERRDGTLGLLFLTELSARDVVWGKLVSSGVASFYGLLALLPALSLALVFGGVSAGQVMRTALALLNALCFTLAAGLAISAITTSRDRAFKRATALIGLFFGLPAVLVISDLVSGHWFALIPFGPFVMATDASFVVRPTLFWAALLITHAETWALLGLAVSVLGRNWRAAAESPHADAEMREQKKVPRADRAHMDSSPILWLASRVPGNRFLVWMGAILLVLSVLAGTWILPLLSWRQSGLGLVLSLGATAPFAWLAGRFFYEGRRSGELELLLSTPLGAGNIVEGYWWAVWTRLRGPLLLACFAAFFQSAILLATMTNFISGIAMIHLILVPASQVLDVIAASWVGMWLGLKARRPGQIVAWTAGLVIALPWLISTLLLFPVAAFVSSVPLAWLGVMYLAKDILFIGWAARQLRTELRTSAPLAVREWFKA